MKTIIVKYKYLSLLLLTIVIVETFVFTSCKSILTSYGEVDVANSGLVNMPLVIEKRRRKITSIQADNFQIYFLNKIEKLEKGRVDLPGRLVYTKRAIFQIDHDGMEVDGESLFSYLRSGIGSTGVENSIYYGRTSQDDFPFTISLVPNENTLVFEGRAKRLNYILDIKGTPFFASGFSPDSTETGFYIYHKDEFIAFVGLVGEKKVFIAPNLEKELYDTTLYTILFLLAYERYDRFPVNSKIVKGE